ncbi:MAG: hypothetical protein M1553_00005 [Firmicutes bacterium]|nr:hypothetical protein [Bacillota bacterium]
MQAQQFVTFNTDEAARVSAAELGKRGINISVEACRQSLGHEVYETCFCPPLFKETEKPLTFRLKRASTPAE